MLTTVSDYIDEGLTHSVHTSERRSFRGCKRRHDWVFRHFYYPQTTAKPLEFGVAFHKAMETLYNPLTWHDWEVATALALQAFKQTVEKQRSDFRAKFGELDGEQEQDYKERIELGLGMLKHYTTKVMPEWDKGWKPIKVEIKFEVPVEGPDGESIWCKCDVCWRRYQGWSQSKYPDIANRDGTLGRDPHNLSTSDVGRGMWMGLPVSYGGRIDMLAQDSLGRLWIVDWKTAAQLTATGDDDYMYLDDQITSYCWALWKLGIPIAGFVYAEIKKAFPQEPEPLTRRYKGRLYSTNKMMPYDLETFATTVKENDLEAYEDGRYDEFIAYLTETPNLFGARHEIPRSEEELRIAGEQIWLEASDITDPKLRIYPSPGRFSCRFCAFQSPCLSKNKGEDYLYELRTMFDKRRYHYYEDKVPSTEGKGGE